MADNFGSSFSDAFSTQQRIGIADKAQQFQEEQARKAEAEKHISQLLTVASNITKAAADAGKDPMTVAGAIQPLIEGAALTAQNTYGPEGAARVQRMGQALLARPPSQQEGSFSGHVVSTPTAENPLGQGIAVLDRKTGQMKVMPVGSSATPNAQVASLQPDINLTGPGKDITGVGVTDIPEGAPAVPASAPVQVAQAQGVAGLTSDAIELRARQLVQGNQDAVRNLPRSKAGMAVQSAIYNRAAEIAKTEFGPEAAAQMNAKTQEFKATTKGAQTLGGRSGNLAGAISIVTATAPIVAELSSKIDRTQFPLINQLIIAGKQQTGDPDVVRLGIALNTVTNGYARAQGGGNNVLTDHAREEARQLLQLAYSDGQLKAGVDQLLVELQREQSKVGDALKDYLKLRTGQIQQSVPQQPPTFITPGGTKFKVLQ